ncbi:MULTISPECIES: deoxyribodipyrimidine photo-lyase [Aphanothece]|uniref:deoxyribodipyrimidine photo-lyase n=1 Tax=Aphanothece TaxID=1121 RepID=UPI003984B831
MRLHVVWFRRDLRLVDHPALGYGSQQRAVLPLFILDPDLLTQPETAVARVAFLLDNRRTLHSERGTRG